MHILAIETSCDETAVAITEAKGNFGTKTGPQFRVLANFVLTQIPLHRKYGGVYPSVAKREHAKNLLPVCVEALKNAKLLKKKKKSVPFDTETQKRLRTTFEHEPELLKQFVRIIPKFERPKIDHIAVTAGPGLEPALWVGINFAKALALVWHLAVIPTNHMEGHAIAALLATKKEKDGFQKLQKISYPAVLLLVSGGHTELVLIKKPLSYELLGATRDDAAGEAFDKTARLLGLPYPGGPEIAKLARSSHGESRFKLPRPMISSESLDFSFSGLKTAVLYTLKKTPKKTKAIKMEMAKEIETAIADVLISKTALALKKTGAQTLILGGGVTANETIRDAFNTLSKEMGFSVLIPASLLTTDNALMIALAGYLRATKNKKNAKSSWTSIQTIRANGNWEITD